ncbi:cell wall galactomannoprotein Mp2/allergen F17-like protein [Aspergillus fumigatus Z5]|nr:cell wall galactomannoprotein Mp2/allergen F17-like protein [Aspergillus fumigatus Z5]
MRFSALTSLLAWGAFTGVLATPTKVSWAPSLVERDFAAVTSVVAAISSKVDALDANIKAYTGGDTSAIVDASADLISTINDGTSTVAAQPALSQVDALNLVNPILALTNKVKTTIDDLISKKSLIVEAGAGPTTYNQLLDQYTASSNLATTLSGKVPEALKQVAEELSSGITSAIQKGIDAYKDTSTPCETTTTTTPPTETTTTPTTPPAETTTTTNVPVPPVTSTTTATETTPCHECEGTTSVPNPPGPTTLTTVPACTTCGGSGGGGGGGGEQPTPPVVVPQPSPSSPTTIAPPGGLSTGAASKLGSSLGTAMAIAAFALLL